MLRVLQEGLERLDAPGPGALQVQIHANEVVIHDAASAGPGDEHVQAPLAAEELLRQRVVARPASFRLGLRIQVLVDEQLAEGEEVQVDLVVLDRPALPSRDGLLDPEE